MKRLVLLLFCAAGLGGCQGVEGDVLFPPAPDLAPVPQADAGAPAFACQTRSLTGMCQSEGLWKGDAVKICQASGLVLDYYSVSTPCAQGYQSAEVLCCPQEILMGCIQETQGDPMAPTCQGPGEWKALADQACRASGFFLESLSLSHPCDATHFGVVTYLCCPKMAP